MQILNLTQGSEDWRLARLSHFCASEAAAMLGLSKKTSRNELLRMKATGAEKEFSDWVQKNLLDKGHEIEAAARPVVEARLGEDLYPTTGTLHVDGLNLLASFDGITMAGDITWECKTLNAQLEADIAAGVIDDEYWPQLEQGLLVSGAERAYFTASNGDGTDDNTPGLWYVSVPARRQRLIAGWKQFADDLASYVPAEVIPASVAAPISDLPALNVQIAGSVIASNLADWKAVVTQRIEAISTDLQTDQDFADADAMTKFLADGEKSLDLVKKQAQSQAESIDTVFRAIDEIRETMRQKRLQLEKLVKERKESIRGEIMQKGKDALAAHIAALNKRLGRVLMPPMQTDFAGAMKGKKTVASLQNAVDTVLANAKIEANETADRIQANLATLEELGKEHPSLFPDLVSIAAKANDDFTALVKTRIAEHKEAEAKRQQKAAEVQQPPAAAVAQPVAQPIVTISTGTLQPHPAAGTVVDSEGWRLTNEIREVIGQMKADELKLVLHYAQRLIAQRQEAA